MRCSPAPTLLPFLLCVLSAEALVHKYVVERVTTKGNAFFIHGGSEGIYSSATAREFTLLPLLSDFPLVSAAMDLQ
ncbi:hypothetical protein ACFX12_004337 [Malus domestica]